MCWLWALSSPTNATRPLCAPSKMKVATRLLLFCVRVPCKNPEVCCSCVLVRELRSCSCVPRGCLIWAACFKVKVQLPPDECWVCWCAAGLLSCKRWGAYVTPSCDSLCYAARGISFLSDGLVPENSRIVRARTQLAARCQDKV